MRSIIFFTLVILNFPNAVVHAQKLDSLPLVFTVGEYGQQYEQLVSQCELPLLHATGRSMDRASEFWLELMTEIEIFAETRGMDIRGVRLWMNIFWDPDGQIRHIVYFPKRSSRNIDFDELGDLLEAFARTSPRGLSATSCYSHFGSTAFPTHSEFLLKKN